jgi:hypothetical protein
MNVAGRILDALCCGWRAACERWRAAQAPPEAKRRRVCSFDPPPGALELSRSDEDEDGREWYASHFRSGWPRR